jgi:hypothetical protein
MADQVWMAGASGWWPDEAASHPAEAVQQIRSTIRTGMGQVLGNDHVPENADGCQPHIRLAYVSTPQPAAATLTAIERVKTEAVEVTIAAASLIEMHRGRRMYEWRTVDELPIGTADPHASCHDLVNP